MTRRPPERAYNSICRPQASYARLYQFGRRFGTFEFGGKIRNAHKFDDTYDEAYVVNSVDESGNPVPIANASHPEWNSTFHDPDYYSGTYGGRYPAVTDWAKVKGYVMSN